MRAATILAHPDDESLWCGGLISSTRHRVQWDCICCTIPYQDPVRALKFVRACEILGARAILFPWTETTARDPLPKAVLNEVHDLLHHLPYDVVVTHGENGEYGHRHHRQLGEFVSDRVPTPRIMRIAYSREFPVGTQVAMLHLDPKHWANKQQAIMAYDHPQPGGTGETKGQALITRYGGTFDLEVEPYVTPEGLLI